MEQEQQTMRIRVLLYYLYWPRVNNFAEHFPEFTSWVMPCNVPLSRTVTFYSLIAGSI